MYPLTRLTPQHFIEVSVTAIDFTCFQRFFDWILELFRQCGILCFSFCCMGFMKICDYEIHCLNVNAVVLYVLHGLLYTINHKCTYMNNTVRQYKIHYGFYQVLMICIPVDCPRYTCSNHARMPDISRSNIGRIHLSSCHIVICIYLTLQPLQLIMMSIIYLLLYMCHLRRIT